MQQHNSQPGEPEICAEPEVEVGSSKAKPWEFFQKVALVTTAFILIATIVMPQFKRVPQARQLPTSARVPDPVVPTSSPQATLSPTGSPQNSPQAGKASKPIAPASKPDKVAIYNVVAPLPLSPDPQLQKIVDGVVYFAQQRGLPIDSLSVSLIDVQSRTAAGYQSQTLRFPASVSKLFWMVALYAGVESGKLAPNNIFYDLPTCQADLCKMIQKSDNEAASRIVDRLTNTISQPIADPNALQVWLQQREQLNLFFQMAGYQDLNISQKNFPIPYLQLDSPQGADLVMRGDREHPIRNRISTEQAARLMDEIVNGQAVSPQASQQMLQLLTRTDLQTGAWKAEPYDPIEGFLGEGLPIDSQFASKVGWTSDSRQEVAYIATPDGRTRYILAVFTEGVAYAEDWDFFPQLSQFVFSQMTGVSHE